MIRRFLWLTLLECLCGMAVFAQDFSSGLPAQFERVESAEQVLCGGYYLIGCRIENRYYFLSNTYWASKKGLKGYMPNESPGNEVTRGDFSLVHHLRPQVNGLLLIARPDSAEALARNGESGLKISRSDTLHYQLQPGEDSGTFSFRNGSRYLSANPAGSAAVFVQFAANRPHSFELFRAAGNDGWQESTAVPDADCQVAVSVSGTVLDAQMRQMPVDDHLLCDGTLAYDDAIALFDLRWKDRQTFTLTDNAGSHPAEITEFELRNGSICVSGAPACMLLYDTQQQKLVTVDSGKPLQTSRYVAVNLLEVGEPPRSHTADGVCFLTGSWKASSLAGLDWKDYMNLDLTQVVLPKEAKAFIHRPKESNAITYVAEAHASFVPSSWPFVVLAGAQGNRLHTSVALADGKPLLIDRSFTVKHTQMTYTRTDNYRDGGWETLCLPFDVNIKVGLRCEIVDHLDVARHELTFKSCEQLQAHTPAIIRFDKMRQITFESREATTIHPYAPAGDTDFAGTYSSMQITGPENIYLLSPDGMAFRKAGAGSRLQPFRAYISGERPFRVRHVQTSDSKQ